jgi:simple sugar transport system ATP-binding protein
MYDGRIVGNVEPDRVSQAELGLMMTGAVHSDTAVEHR